MLTMKKEIHIHNFHLLLHSADLVHEYLRSQLLPLNLTPQQARVIKTLSRLGEVSQVDLAREFAITPASMSTMTTRLIAADFIVTRKDPINAKRNLLRLTSKGEGSLNDITLVWTNVDKYIEDKIGVNKQQELTELTLLLRDSLGGFIPGTK